MGLFDMFKKKAQEVTSAVSSAAQAPVAAPAPAPAAAARVVPRGPTFEWNETTFPVPAGWSDLSVDDWFLKMERTRDRLMHADEEDLEPMNGADGEPLDPEEVLLLKLGFESGNHFECFRSWGVDGWARKQGQSAADFEFRMSGIARDKLIAEKTQSMSGGGGALEPVEGVSMQAWAGVQAGVAGGKDLDALLAQAGLDRAKWERVSAEWLARMTTDTTGVISTAYGAAFAGGSQNSYGAHAAHAAAVGVAGDLSAEPMSFERWVEAQEAMSAASDRGDDPSAALAAFGLTPADFGNVGAFWSKKLQQEMTKYHQLYTQYSDKYRAKYRD